MNDKLVYIILVDFNAVNDTMECLDSLSKLNYGNHQVIVVENGAVAIDILEKAHPEVTFIKTGENLGFAGGNNIGIQVALKKGADYVLLLNNDTVVEPDFLGKLVESAETDSIDIVCPQILNYYEKDVVMYAGGEIVFSRGGPKMYGLVSKCNEKYELDYPITFAHGCCMLVRNEVLEKIQLPEEFFLYYEDTAFSIMAMRLGMKMGYVGSSHIFHKVSSSTKKDIEAFGYYLIRNRLLLIKKYISFPLNLFAYLFAIVSVMWYWLIGGYNWNIIKEAYSDFLHNKSGRRSTDNKALM